MGIRVLELLMTIILREFIYSIFYANRVILRPGRSFVWDKSGMRLNGQDRSMACTEVEVESIGTIFDHIGPTYLSAPYRGRNGDHHAV